MLGEGWIESIDNTPGAENYMEKGVKTLMARRYEAGFPDK